MTELTYIEKLAARQLTPTDREFWRIVDADLGHASYGEFLFSEAVEVLKKAKVVDPEGHVLLWLEQGYLYGGRSIMRAKNAPFRSQPEGVNSLHVSPTGEDIAKLGRLPK
jgi:hypothetical protein